MLGLRFCARAFSSCGKRGPLLIAVRGPLTIAASLVAEHRLQTRRLSNLFFQFFKIFILLGQVPLFIFLNIYLFIYLVALGLSCGSRTP